jgi:tRNA dimethylallyltransferase
MNMKPPLVIIAGPTASGKSALALALSRLTPTTIINADASQVYHDLRIVTARPSVAEEAEVPHRLFGTVDGSVACSAAFWAAEAKEAIADAQSEGRLPVLVGGTGLYLRTLLDGIAPVPDIDPNIRTSVRALTTQEAYRALEDEDAEAAARLSANDSSRVSRALEVIRSTGRTLIDWQRDRVGGISHDVKVTSTVLLPPREWLFDRCDTRFDKMVEDGGIAEVTALLARRLNPALPVMRAIGVREIAAMIEHREDAANHITQAKIATRQYAKRQYTWFRNQPLPRVQIITEQLKSDMINDLAIICRNSALTG